MANTSSLMARIEKLEVAAGIGRETPVIVIDFVSPNEEPGYLIGLTHAGEFIERKPGETEEALIGRVEAIVRKGALPGCIPALFKARRGEWTGEVYGAKGREIPCS
jgi:hypothetical protein